MSRELDGPLRHPVLMAALLVALAIAVLSGGRASPGDSAPPDESAPRVAEAVGFPHATTIDEVAHDEPVGRARPAPYPSSRARRKATRYARGRAGRVSFALIDSRGRLFGLNAGRRYVSASIVKAPLMVAELRRQSKEKPSNIDPGTAGLLRAMITHSDNSSADAIYYRGGDAALYDVAARTGMRRFSVQGHWGNAQVTAADLARFMDRFERAVPRRHRSMARRLLEGVVPDQRWGIPAAAEPRWRVELKGGWRSTTLGELVHQAARLERRGTRLALAVLTDAQPSQAYGRETVEGIAARLLARPLSARASGEAS